MTDSLITEWVCPPQTHQPNTSFVEITNSVPADIPIDLKPYILRDVSTNMNELEMISLIFKIGKLMLRRLLGFY